MAKVVKLENKKRTLIKKSARKRNEPIALRVHINKKHTNETV